MTTVESKLARHLGAMRCVHCGGDLKLNEHAVSCSRCAQAFPISGGIPFLVDASQRQAAAGPMEALFRFPSFYQFKFNLLRLLNPTDELRLDVFLDGKDVLDAGCGPFPYGYDVRLPRSIVGFDLSAESVRAISKLDPANLYLVADTKKLPFKDNAFDTALLRFVIHHVPGSTEDLLREISRVTREHVIIFDHVRSDVGWQRAIQTTYWRTFDSGHHYNTLGEWDTLLQPYRVVAFRRTGRMFGNVCQIVLNVRPA